MKFRPFARALPAIALVLACTPISPSVHKSTLRPGASLAPKADAPAAEAEIPIEARWIRGEKRLNSALDAAEGSVILRLSSFALDRLKAEGRASVEIPAGLSGGQISGVRVLMRVELPQESLERALSEESWTFAWDVKHPKTLEIRADSALESSASSVLGDAVVSVHVVLQSGD